MIAEASYETGIQPEPVGPQRRLVRRRPPTLAFTGVLPPHPTTARGHYTLIDFNEDALDTNFHNVLLLGSHVSVTPARWLGQFDIENLHVADTDHGAIVGWGFDAPNAPGPITTSFVDSIIGHLARLPEQWAGQDTRAPLNGVMDDISAVATALQGVTRVPEAEVDEDGSVALVWDEGDRSFALTFCGNGQVVGTLSPWSPDYAPWSLDVRDEARIAKKLEDEQVTQLLGKR